MAEFYQNTLLKINFLVFIQPLRTGTTWPIKHGFGAAGGETGDDMKDAHDLRSLLKRRGPAQPSQGEPSLAKVNPA